MVTEKVHASGVPQPVLSIVIPALNEASVIGRQIACVRLFTGDLDAEIIVVDNGSTDGTPDIARAAGANIVTKAAGTIARARNSGVALSSGRVLLFLDADVFPTEAWARRIADVAHEVLRDRLLTGSKVGIPEHPSWIERYWFAPTSAMPASYINSGHMIISRALFDELGGFNERLKTGEDFDLSERAKAAGALVRADPTLPVIHEGFPKTLGQFVKRELWHGTGDCQSVSRFVRSKVALAGTVVLHVLLFSLALSTLRREPGWFAAAVVAVILFATFASVRKYRNGSLEARTYRIGLFVAYFLARGLSPYLSGFQMLSGGHRR